MKALECPTTPKEKSPQRKIVGFDHALELNAVLWNDEKGKKFLRKILQNKRKRLEKLSLHVRLNRASTSY